MDILPDDMQASELYRLLTGVVVPRPIAWVTSLGPNGVVNLAPFSCFTFVSPKPPMIGISIGTRDGAPKDTARNIAAITEFVVNIADDSMIESVHRSAFSYPPDVSEVEAVGMSLRPSRLIGTPCLAGVPISMECRFIRSIDFGSVGSKFVVGEILAFHVADGLSTDYKIDTQRLRPVGRIAGSNYATLGRIVSMGGDSE